MGRPKKTEKTEKAGKQFWVPKDKLSELQALSEKLGEKDGVVARLALTVGLRELAKRFE